VPGPVELKLKTSWRVQASSDEPVGFHPSAGGAGSAAKVAPDQLRWVAGAKREADADACAAGHDPGLPHVFAVATWSTRTVPSTDFTNDCCDGRQDGDRP
jgi:hypothetical protein